MFPVEHLSETTNMARPRKYVRIAESDGSISIAQNGHGREIHGLSYNASNRTYYTIDDATGKRVYLGRNLADAVAAVERPQHQRDWETSLNDSVEIQRAIDDLIVGPIGKETNHKPDTNAVAAILEFARQAKSTTPTPSKHRLSDCLKCWTDWSTNDGATITANTKDNEKRFKAFIRCVGNLPISTITYEHFAKWQKWIKQQQATRWESVKTAKDHHSTIHKVLTFAKRKNRDWKFPDGLLEWSTDWKFDKEGKTPYVPKVSNREPMPVDVYRRCLSIADEWANIDATEFDATTQQGRGQRRQATVKQREGVQFAALLRLIIHGLDTVDCTRLQWSDLIDLDGDLPYFDFPREKVKHRTGYAIDRKTPLLPDCVAALKRWRDYEKPGSTIFKNAQGRPYNSSTLAKAFAKLRPDEGWTLKHLRNVGSTLADQNGMSEMIVDRFLGHTLKKARAKYLGTVGPTYLVDLVTLIGDRYFPTKPKISREKK